MWEANKTQETALESVMLGGAKRILGCSSKTRHVMKPLGA